MSLLDYLLLDGRSLNVFLVVLEEGSVSKAAERLNMPQSSVSHTLDKLRSVIGDELFMRSGRGITPSQRALELKPKISHIVRSMKELLVPEDFNPAEIQIEFSIGANDFQRDLILPAFFRRVRAEASGISFKVLPSFLPTIDMLRDDYCQLMITPHPPEGGDIVQRRLIQDDYVCYYDSNIRDAPASLIQYKEAQHVVVVFQGKQQLLVNKAIKGSNVQRNIFLTLPNFSGISSAMRGTDLIATLPGLLSGNMVQGLASCSLPFSSPILTIYMAWHKRHQTSKAHIWLRNRLLESCQSTHIL